MLLPVGTKLSVNRLFAGQQRKIVMYLGTGVLTSSGIQWVTAGKTHKNGPLKIVQRAISFRRFRWFAGNFRTWKATKSPTKPPLLNLTIMCGITPAQWLEPWCNWLDHRSGNRYRPTCPPSSFFSSSLVSDSRCYKRKPKRCILAKKKGYPYLTV